MYFSSVYLFLCRKLIMPTVKYVLYQLSICTYLKRSILSFEPAIYIMASRGRASWRKMLQYRFKNREMTHQSQSRVLEQEGSLKQAEECQK